MRSDPLYLLALFALGCAETPAARGAPPPRIERCDYQVAIGEAAERLDVTASCSGHVTGFRVAERPMRPYVNDVTAESGERLASNGALFRFDDAGTRARVRYSVDLARAAEELGDFDLAERVGASLVAPASSFLLVPEPVTDFPVRVSVTSRDGVAFATGLRRDGSGFALEAHEIPFATYSFFGRLSRETLTFDGAELEVVTLDGPLATPPAVRTRWIEASARAVSAFYGRFPVPRAVLGVIPVPDRDGVVFGKVLPESAPGIVLRVGEQATERALYADWVLVHELFHLGFPSFRDEGKWLDEGLATYFEPIIRARAGFITERDVWREFARDMPNGLGAVEGGLENARDYRGMYWGGAIACLLTDVEARRGSGGKIGLEHGLRRIFDAGGNASEVWTLERTVAIADSAFEKPVLRDVAKAFGTRGGSVDLRGLFARLGVRETEDGIELDEGAPLAAVRRAIVHGSPR